MNAYLTNAHIATHIHTHPCAVRCQRLSMNVQTSKANKLNIDRNREMSQSKVYELIHFIRLDSIH